jgi:hypothetical protein
LDVTTTLSDTVSDNGRDLAHTFESLPRLASADSDYFCEKCGYNLHGQPVRRDPNTQILLMRCPECGTFHPAVGASSAGRLWVARLARSMLMAWVIVAYFSMAMIVVAHAVIVEICLTLVHGTGLRFAADASRTVGILTAGGIMSALLGFASASLCALVFPHWKRWSLVIAAFAWPTMSATLTFLLMNQQATLFRSADPNHILILAFSFVAGGLCGAGVGHTVARLMVRIVIPPNSRQALTHLWGRINEV